MIQSHWLIAGTCIVSLGAGYLAGIRRDPATSKVPIAVSPSDLRRERSAPRDRDSRGGSGDELLSALLKGRSTRDLSSHELAKLVVQLSKYSPSQSPVARARQTYQLQLLLTKLSASQLEQAAVTLAGDPESRRTGVLAIIVGPLAAKDPQRAMAWAKTQPNSSSLLSIILGQMAKDSPMEAAKIYRDELMNNTFQRNDVWNASYGISNAMAKQGKMALLDFVDGLPMQQQNNILGNCFRELPEGDRLAMMDAVYQRSKTEGMQDWNLNNTFSQLAALDSEAAKKWVQQLEPGKKRASLELSQAAALSQAGDPDAAREWMSSAIAHMQGSEKELLQEAIRAMAYHAPNAIAEFAGLLPADIEIRAEDLKSQASNSLYNGLGGLVDLAGVIRDPNEQAVLIRETLEDYATQIERNSGGHRLNHTDFEIFSRRLRGLGLTGDASEQVEQALANAKAAVPKPSNKGDSLRH